MDAQHQTCKYCQKFNPYLWQFVHLYLDGTNTNNLQSKDVLQYYKNLIDHFLKIKFFWKKGRPDDVSFERVEDLPFKLKANAVDCLGVALSIGPKAKSNGVSFLYDVFLKYYT